MKIAVNTRFLITEHLEGIGWFTYETLKRITQQHPEHEFYFFFDRKFSNEFIFSSNIHPQILSPPARHPLLWYWWFEVAVPRALKRIIPDLFLSTDGYLSLRTNCRQVIVMHDIAFEHFNDHIDSLATKFYRHYTPKYAQKAARIATVSRFSKDDICFRYHVSPEKIDVVYNGSNEMFKPLTIPEQQVVRDQFTRGRSYFIYAGAIQPRKNLIKLFLAFDMFKKKIRSDIKLVIAGRNWNYHEASAVHSQMQFSDDVIFPGHLTRSDLSRLMAASMGLIYISLFEGFGIPIIEAMNCNVPVITSNVSSMPEVAGNAALFADPHSIDDIALKMEMLYTDEFLRKELVEKGKVQSQKFTWQQTADGLYECMMKAVRK
ncbi:MAG: glycosyltransferase family 4 protein [Chitinophagales bacterium]|nr:glycosyltransferase family 4 protein [Chitinophagales bacterium]